MFQDETFFKTLKVTFFFAFVSVPLKLLFALIVAMLLLENSKMSGFYRAAYYLPSIIGGSVAVSILWKRMFAMDGVVNKLLGMVGIQTSFSWLGDTRTAIWVLILLVVWQFGSSMLIFLSSLKQVPQSLYEAAEVDGASAPAKFFKITLPLLTPTIFFNLVMQMINGFLAFTQSYIITQGKPMNSTLFYTVYMYQQSFEFYNTGYGAALAWVMLAIIGLITLFLFALVPLITMLITSFQSDAGGGFTLENYKEFFSSSIYLRLTGKTIVLFATSGGSGMGKTASVLRASAPGAKIVDGGILNNASNASLEKFAARYL